ncbi:putative methyltransferase [Actinoplanes missouriensis 431]|uniref:Putative methyltransferase n=1 Tax=Actinoplanes missouriensis (strain ATCC 14538 / DSM 43046 / CBS 188.64 / JCM 3121 / NBRC 102363 / NCIMB 12654 / NRRL B-3342 / UNCC 431) TaxID=512565 RepID=I0H269_ACTM4|nr:alpha-(1->3)-arabinofuranosyltransferase family protein [Actinoplanes missouriensis]BAL87106.1 putative methyltransferase [Actinoplanes missouriensis 431]
MTAVLRARTTFDNARSSFWVPAGALLLVVAAFIQRPGQTTFDTKLDLVENPIGFMARALHLWNPWATSGELQQQAYGYLFPMAPFFAVGDALGIPAWITQRLWCAALFLAAYFGVLLLARALRIGNDAGRVVGAFAYAVAPRMLTEVGVLSSEMLPVAALPWVLLPLVTARRFASPRRAAALSALAVLFMGGINAAAVVMALVLPGLWLLTRRWDRQLFVLMAWWAGFVLLTTLWWIIPLLLFGQYSLPFLDFIESSATTTAVTSLFQATRGTNQWVGYIVQGEPWWPAGWSLIDNPALMVVTALVAALGLLGLGLRGLPEKRFLVIGALTGLALLTMGYVGTLDSPFAPLVRELLDGPLAPLRNVHKFEPVLRLPIALGLAYAASHAPVLPRWRIRVPAAPVVAVLLIAAAAPAWTLLLRPGPGWSSVPSYWSQATTWLADQDAQDRTLVVPGSGFSQNTWGRTVDEPIQPLAESPWSTRNQIPLGSEGNIRVMDTVEAVLAQGRGSPALADFLARSGYQYLMVRHDLDRTVSGAPPITVVRQAITNSPGLVEAATFGPRVGAGGAAPSPADAGVAVPAIEIFKVDRDVPAVSATAIAGVPVVSGGPESLLGVLEEGLIDPAQPAVLAGDQDGELAIPEAAGQPIVTDGLRRRELNIGRMRDNTSQTLTEDEKTRQGRVRSDLLPFDADGHQTVAAYQGIRAVDASSSASFADSIGASDSSALPFAALDGDTSTAWRSDPIQPGSGQWIEVQLETAQRITEVTVDFSEDLRTAAPVSYVRITTDQGIVDRPVPATAGAHKLSTLPGLTTSVRVTVLALREGYDGGVALRELGIPGVSAERGLRVPADTGTKTAPAYVFERATQDRGACYADDGVIRCDQFLARAGEEPLGVDRFFATPVNATYDLRLTARPRTGGTLPLDRDVTASASTTLTGDVTAGAHAAVDGDPSTTWLAEPNDPTPTLTLSWDKSRRIDRFRLDTPDSPTTAAATQVLVRAGGKESVLKVEAEGWVRIPPVTTKRLEISIVGTWAVVADPRGDWPAPAGVSEVEIPALKDLMKPATGSTPLLARCGTGPSVVLDGVSYPTAVSGTLGDVRAGNRLPVRICDDFASQNVQLTAGEHRLRTVPSAAYVAESATLVRDGAGTAAPAATTRTVSVVRWEATDRQVMAGAGEASLLVIPENRNAGWTATLDGRELRAVRVDGWQQAFVLPAGSGGLVSLRFTPDGPYRTGLAAGAACVLLVVLAAAAPVRRRVAPVSGPPARIFRAVPGGQWWMLVPLLALVFAIGGAAGVTFLLGALIVRQLWPRALSGLAFAAAVAGLLIAVSGRLLGHGQEWAYDAAVQLAMLAAIAAVAATAAPTSSRRRPDPEPMDGAADGDIDEEAPVDAHRATLDRSVGLFRAFLVEQTDPDRFYSELAVDSVRQLGSYTDLDGALVLDVGGGPGYFSTEFEKAGARYVGLDPAVGDFAAAGAEVSGMIRGSGTALPIRTGSVDVAYSSNVLEHVPDPEALLDELVRVTKPGGTVFVSFTPWLSPHGGHETGPFWHLLGGDWARRRFVRKNGREPKNRYMESLFPISAARTMRWARAARRNGELTVVDVLPRYHPRWAQWVARVPLLRETLTWNFTVVLRRTGEPVLADVQEDLVQVSRTDVTQ